nr:zinc finger, CCHC-type [Tanacetum cinerariifolium]
MWNELSDVMSARHGIWILFGDFNAVHCSSERHGSVFNARETNTFNEFIARNGLLDFQMDGREFTRFSRSGDKTCKLDRFLVSHNFSQHWSDTTVTTMCRFISDHSHVILKECHQDFGPCLFIVFDFWCECDGFDDLDSKTERGLLCALDVVLVKGLPTKEFHMEKGLHQGDPLSLLLFIIVAEALQVSILDACDNGIFNGLALANDISNLSLLQYADDVLYFGEWFVKNAKNLDDAIVWCINSGATTHVCKDRCWFKTYETVEDIYIIYMGDDQFAPIHGKENVVLEFSLGKSVTLFNMLAFVRLLKPKRKTLGKKGTDCIFVEYVENSKTYSFYVIKPNDPVSINSIIKSRDVIFDENRFSSMPRPKDIIQNSNESQRDDHSNDVPSETPKLRRGCNDLQKEDESLWNNWQVQGWIVDKTKKFLSSRFSMKDMGEADVMLVIKIKCENKGIIITQSHYIEKILKKFNREDCSSVSTLMDPIEKLKPNTDSSFISVWVFLLEGGAISWAFKKQTCITGSTMEFEFVALVAAGKEAKWPRNLIHEILIWMKPIASISIHCDSAATLAKAYSQIYNGKSKHLGVRHSMIRELIMNSVISIEFVLSQHNLADHLTKDLARDLVNNVLPDGDDNNKQNLCYEHHEGVSLHRYRFAPPSTPEGSSWWSQQYKVERKLDKGGFGHVFVGHPVCGGTGPVLEDQFCDIEAECEILIQYKS